MQNCYSPLRAKWSIFLVIALSPLLLYAVIQILPTHDDWASTTTPDFSPFFIKEHFLFYGYHWRPFDTWIGYIVGRNPQLLYPSFNHILVVIGHLLCTLTIYHLLSILNFSTAAKNITTLFFFITPATMATVLAVDSQNQTYALFIDLLAFLFYIKNNKWKYVGWTLLIFIATLTKENGLMWALICPIMAYAFSFINSKTLKKDLIIGIAIMIAYALAIILLPKDITIHPEYEPNVMKIVKNIIKFFFTSFITVDYIYLLHQPSRSLLLSGITLLFTLPFFYYIYIKPWKSLLNRKIICIIICLLIAVAPHLGTVFSMMHTYAGLAIIAIITAYSIDSYQHILKPIVISFVLWITATISINIHLIDSSIKSGVVGKKMAIDAIQKTGSPVDNVYVIIIQDDYPKLSSFCVIPNEAFGWGLAARYETNYQWPETIQDTIIQRSEDYANIVEGIFNNSSVDCVWIVNHDQIRVINNE